MSTTYSTVEALATSAAAREDFMRAFEHLPLPFFLVDLQHRIIAGNPAFARFLGYTVDELPTLTIAGISHPEDLGPSMEQRMEMLAGKREMLALEKRYLRKDGSTVWGKLMGGPIGPPQVGLGIATVEDITARKSAEAEIARIARQSEEERNFYLTAFDYIPNGVLIAGASGEIIYHNRQVERIWGVTLPPGLEDLVPLVQAFHPDGTPFSAEDWPITRALEHGEYVSHELIRNLLPDGSTIHMHNTAAPIRNAAGEIIAAVAVLSDITPIREAEEQRERLVRELEATQRELQLHRDVLEGKVRESTEELAHQSSRLRHLSADLAGAEQRERHRIAGSIHDEVAQTLAAIKLSLAHLSANPDLQPVTGDLKAILEMVDEAILQSRAIMAELSPPVLHEQGLLEALRWWGGRVSERSGLEVAVTSAAEPARLEPEIEVILFQASKELIQNAVKHAGASRIEVAIECEDTLLRIDIVDNGKGFGTAGAGLTESSGFGLFNVRERMSYLGGRLELHSEPGSGTRASLLLPLPCSVERAGPAPTASV